MRKPGRERASGYPCTLDMEQFLTHIFPCELGRDHWDTGATLRLGQPQSELPRTPPPTSCPEPTRPCRYHALISLWPWSYLCLHPWPSSLLLSIIMTLPWSFAAPIYLDLVDALIPSLLWFCLCLRPWWLPLPFLYLIMPLA